MINRTLHTISLILLLTGVAAPNSIHAQSTPTPKSAIKITGNIYGGGEMAKVAGNTNVTINAGQFGGSIFGGGEGALNNDGTVKASADISGDTHVIINGGEIVYNIGDKDNLRNIYGGGNLACNVAGNTNVTMTKGMITTYSFTSSPYAMAAWRYFYDTSMKPNQQKTPICSVFGAGYGSHTDVAGNTNISINIPGTADIHPDDGEAFTYAELEAIDRLALRLKPDTKLSEQFVPSVFGGGFDGTVGAYDSGTGGINYDKTTYSSQANITIQGQPFVFNVFGGGLGSKSGADATGGVDSHVGAVYGATKVDIQGGIINGDVFGGGAGIESEADISNPFTHEGTIKMPYTYAAQVMRETDVTISGNTTVIFGNVYGGGDIANTGWYVDGARPTMTGHKAQLNSNKATLDFTTSLNLNGGNVLGSVFGGGNGRKKAQMQMSMFVGTVCGSTNVSVNGAKVWSHVYGGGNMGMVFDCKTIAASKGDTERAMATGVIDGCTNVAILNGMVAKDIFGGGFGDDPGTGEENVTSADVYGNTYVDFTKADLEYAKYWKPRTFLPSDATNEQMLAEVTGQFLPQMSGGIYDNTESDVCHNLYGGGNMACTVKGNTFVYMSSAPSAPAGFSSTDYYKAAISNVAKPHFSSFGGGFGVLAKVEGNAHSDINLNQGSGMHSIIGGGMNGAIGGGTTVHIGNNPQSLVHFVYGGGYYAPCKTTNVQITRGTILEDVFGGSLMGSINDGDVATQLTIGLKSEGAGSSVVIKNENGATLREYTYENLKNQITIMGNVYGGNDVSGIVNGIAKLTLNGGTVKGDVYGAGNGDHLGYYEPGIGHYTDGKNNNYYVVDHSGDTDSEGNAGPSGDTYKGRPQTTGGVDLTLAGNTETERVTVLGQVFGGGNSCTIGQWDATLLAEDGKYHGDPHLVRDDPAYFLGGGQLHVTIGSHVTIGRTHAQLVDAGEDGKKYLNNESENVSGLYMGCSGRHLATQNTDKEDHYYHHYYDKVTARYWPGFAVYSTTEVNPSTEKYDKPLTRAEGLASFNAYLNNILVWSDDVTLTIDDDAEDIWLANFVGGGFRGSMKAMTAEGQFHYTLPRGVTVGHGIVGGAYNTDVVYRIFATSDGHTYTETDGHYNYLTEVGSLTKYDKDTNPNGDYHHIEYAADGTTPTGIIRFYYDGGMLSHDNYGSRRKGVFNAYDSGDDNVIDFSGFTSDQGLRKHKDKALVYLEARCQLEPEVIDEKVHGGNVFGGCFESGTVDGDVWTDYRGYIAPKWYGNENFNGGDKMFANAADYQSNFAMMAFGAGYGKNTSIKGDTYLRIIYNKESGTATYPCLYNVFGGSFQGTVDGNTNIYYNAGQQGLTVGGIYGGGSQGYVAGKSFVELAGGYIANVYGGAREANVGKGTHVWAYDGALRNWADDLTEHDDAPLVVERMFGGSDVSGLIGFKAGVTDVNDADGRVEDAGWTAYYSTSNWPEELFVNGKDGDLKKFDSYIQIGGTDHSDRGYPLVGQIYAGGNGENTDTEHGQVIPGIDYALIELNDGNVMEAFGGGNAATVHKQNYILVNGQYDPAVNMEMPNSLLTQILQQRVLKNVTDCYTLSGNTFTFDPYNVQRLFGGNNVATMDIQPKWNLKSGHVGKVYSGGNMGDMTYYNADADTENGESKGLSITVNSKDIEIGALYGGCRMSDVKAMDGDTPVTLGDDEYGATVNVLAGHIGNVYGGNDVSGYVYNGTNVNLKGSITGNVYGAGNGDYIYAYDNTETQEHSAGKNIKEEKNADINKTVYWIKGNKNATVLQRLLAINNARPHVAKAYLNIAGTHSEVGEKVYISGSVYCGGNASTIRPMTDEDEDAHVKFNIGDNVIVNEVFMGSNGASLKSEAYLQDFETVNPGFAEALQQEISWDDINEDNVSLADKELVTMNTTLRHNLYPNLLSVYMRAVDMKAMPKGFDGFSTHNFNNTWIGTFCMGGNAGSMMTDQPVDIVFPQSLNFFGRIIGGSKDASFQYKGKWHRGGFRMPVASTATLDDQPTKTKLRMKIRGDWYSRRMNMDPKYKNVVENEAPMGDYLVYDKTDNGIDWKVDGKAWHDGCNVYGGCYQSGDMVGDVEIYIESDMLAYSRYEVHNIDAYQNDELDKSNELNLPVANVYGAGYGPESRSFGDAYIYMKDIPGNVGYTHPSVNNIFGGGRNGMLVGNSVIHVHDGLVYKDVVGGSFAAPLYGSSQVTVGYPKFYVCKKSGEYFIDRADKWNAGHMTKGKNGPEDVIKTSIKYFEGTYVPCNVYDQITGVKLHGSKTITDLSDIHTATRQDNGYFSFHDEGEDNSFFPTGGWASVEIRVRGGVYGGGFSLSNSTAATAGSYTTLASTADYNHGVDSQGNSSVGYGGNSSIIISDFVGELADGQTAKDHIKISTETTKAGNEPNKEYTGTGGVYGDGRLVFCEGFRAAELNGYGYAEHTPSNPLMLNSLQRLDLLTVNDCCFKLYGDHDFATDELNSQKYSLARIGELRMNSSIDADSDLAPTKSTTKPLPDAPQTQEAGNDEPAEQPGIRNYIGFYNNIHYLGAIATNDDFKTAMFHDADGKVGTISYRDKKQEYINKYHGEEDELSINTFKQRNYATARNAIGINSGYSLRVENQYYDNNERKTYYGPIVGVAEVKLLNVQPGEGGGYVYADNIHDEGTPTFMNESGNFVFEGVIRPGEDAKQYIVDDCLPKGFDEVTPGAELPEQHYWYVIGDTYYYNTTLTAYSYNNAKTFDLINADPNVIFAGIENGSVVSIESVKWLPQTSTYPDGYDSDIRGGRDDELQPLSGDDKYKFMIHIGDESTWKKEMPRSTNADDDAEKIPQGDKPTGTYTAAEGKTLPSSPRFNVRLIDNVDNCPKDHEEEYYNNHLSMPEKVQLIVKSTKGDETKTYNVTLEVVYLQGPSFTGNVLLKNCALPGEHIGFSSDGINIKTTEQLPVIGYGWKLVPLKSERLNAETGKMEYEWDTNNAIPIPSTYYKTATNGSVEGSIPALYSQNHWNIFYTFNAGGEIFTVEPTKDDSKALSERMLMVHNYHKLADIVDKYDVNLASGSDIYAKALKQGAMIYLADANDIDAFVSYVNAGNATEGMHFYLQNDLTLSDAITGTFAGTLHGDGYSLTLPTNGASLFGDKLTGKVYNLGVPNGTIASAGTITNSFTSTDAKDDLLYGKKAYELSHYYTTDNDPENYVHTYYANNDGMGGDWRYARSTAAGTRYLRTAVSPNYGLAQTSHNKEHADAYDITPHDCLFFGQELAVVSGSLAARNPQHIADNEDNRVYRTAGYYRSTDADKFHYNRRAWALQPTLTAIDFTAENADIPDGSPSGFYGKTDDRAATLVSFNSDSNASIEQTDKVTKNLLVYHNEDVNIISNEKPNTTEAEVSYHAVRKADATGTTPQFHLVDKQDFCAPIEFSVTERAWYERKPVSYAESNNDAWEGICLPFTVSKATASLNGEISHFYGQPTGDELTDPAKDIHTLHHEYWLRGLVSISSSDGKTTANFQRPGAASPLFTQGTATVNYDYKNTWFKETYGDLNYNGSALQNNWYYTDATHTYADYKPLEANIPYIVSFPGSRYYEFDLSSQFYTEKTGNDAAPQTITFSTGQTTIHVTPAIQTTDNGYAHNGTFIRLKNVSYGMNTEGTEFSSSETTVLPFRTYMTTAATPAKAKSIAIGSRAEAIAEGHDNGHGDPSEGEVTETSMVAYAVNHDIIIESTCTGNVFIYNAAGQLVRAVNVYEGINRYPGFAPGMYIVNGRKLMVR